jgi:PAS domain S-box-containing protein
MAPIRILLIEDSLEDVRAMQEALAAEAGATFTLTSVGRLADGLQHLAAEPVDVVLLDLKLPDSDGLETVVRIRRQAPGAAILVLTASDDTATAIEAVKRGAEDYLVKGYVQVYPNLLSRAIYYAVQRKRAEEAVRKAHAQTERLLASIPSILIRLNPAGTVTYWNPVAQATFGIAAEDILGEPFSRCGIGWDLRSLQARIAECQRANQPVSLDDMAYRGADGREGFLGITIVPMRAEGAEGEDGVLIFGADVTERKQAEVERARLQGQLLQAQKMETIGRFAGGIAHDFNNFLQVILGFAWLIRARHQKNPALMSDLQEIVHAAESASDMVHQLLAFSRRQPLQPKTFEINRTIRHMARLLQQFVGNHVRVELELAEEPLPVRLDPTGLEQILMNLGANARDSMPEPGTLTIRTGRLLIDAAFLASHPGAKPGDYVVLSIQDTGTGMDPHVAAHIFEPFFTTKQTGKGTGLGLAVVYGLVQQHEGFIAIDTALGRGTTFHLYFPYQELSAEEQAALLQAGAQTNGGEHAEALASGEAPAAPAGRQAKPRVLVVDDDPSIRRMCERMLKRRYDVTVAESGQEALDLLERRRFTVLLSDLRMPNMDGVTLLKRVVKLRHAPKLLAMTGSISREMEQRLQTVPLTAEVLRKPFTAPMIMAVIDRCLQD